MRINTPLLQSIIAVLLISVTPCFGQPRGSVSLRLSNYYSTAADQIVNAPLTFNHRWDFAMNNASATPILNPVAQVQTSLALSGFYPNDPAEFTADPAGGTYTWHYTGALQENQFFDPSAADPVATVVASPLFSVTRNVTPEVLTGASTQQTVTFSVTFEQALPPEVNTLYVDTGMFQEVLGGYTLIQCQFVSQNPVPGWNAFNNGTVAIWSMPPANVQVGQTYTFQAALNCVKSPQLLGSPIFKPSVEVVYNRTTRLPGVTGTSVVITYPLSLFRSRTIPTRSWTGLWVSLTKKTELT